MPNLNPWSGWLIHPYTGSSVASIKKKWSISKHYMLKDTGKYIIEN